MDEFKPLNVQFVISDKETADALRKVADALGDKVGDRRIRGAAAAKALVTKLLKSNSAEELARFLSDESGMTMDQTVERIKEVLPKGRSPRQAKK